MYGKILIKAKLHVLTGMHIGSSNTFSAIGAVDSIVIKDPVTKLPIIPGSSLKGKLRTLLARSIANSIVLNDCNNDPYEVKRLFGSSGKDKIYKSRLQFADAFLLNSAKLQEVGGTTEVKFENTISRTTSIANPRQIERVVRGAIFDVAIVYDIENEEEVIADFENLSKAIKLLHLDYLGGHGTRGYGKVKFADFEVKVIEGDSKNISTQKLSEIIKGVEDYEVLSI
ncbi:MAG: type III-A CRISPR-associated RAMP protein Csm3 [Desulfitobacteriia bacterium]|jgi:CRISPR-associated protein Csm3